MRKAILLFAIGFSSPTQLLAQTWSTAGNATTTANFLGTTNAMRLNFKVNNVVSGFIDTGNVAFGDHALAANTSGDGNIAMGNLALSQNTIGCNNTALGSVALRFNTTGFYNTAIGAIALNANTTGTDNAAIGEGALMYNIDGGSNIAIGSHALVGNRNGSSNIGIGSVSLDQNNGSDNTAIGLSSLYALTTGVKNTVLGNNTLFLTTTGSNNCGIGYNSGNAITNTAITNWVGLGYNTGTALSRSNTVELGNTSIVSIRAQVTGITAYSDARVKDNVKANVKGLDFINRLRPVTYNLNIHRENDIIYKNKKQGDADFAGKYDIEKLTQTGFIAQEVEKAAIESGYDFTGVEKPNTPDGLYSVRYTDFIMPIVKSVQELSATNEQLKKQNEDLQTQIDELRALIHDMHHAMTNCCANYLKANTSSVQTTDGSQEPLLTQNFPNPFTMNTLIRCTIPGNFNSAIIKVSTTTGSEVMTFPVHQTGTSEFTIQSGALSPGMYQYSLIIDGKMIDTKKMVLTK